jgi:hypothetical protein
MLTFSLELQSGASPRHLGRVIHVQGLRPPSRAGRANVTIN